jgi:hypothetical protein
VLEVVDEIAHGHAGASEHGLATQYLGVGLNDGTGLMTNLTIAGQPAAGSALAATRRRPAFSFGGAKSANCLVIAVALT